MGDGVTPLSLGGPHDAYVGDGLESAVGAAVENGAGLARHELALPAHSGLKGDDRRMAGVGRHQFLGVCHDHLYRPSRKPREMIAKGSVHGCSLRAEISSDGSKVN